MTPESLVGSLGVRQAAASLSLLCVAGVLFYRKGTFAGWDTTVLVLTILCGVLAFMCFVHCFQPVFEGWMKFAQVLNTIVVSILFGAVYLLVVPLFYVFVWVLDPLRLRNAAKAETFWIERTNKTIDVDSMQRMG